MTAFLIAVLIVMSFSAVSMTASACSTYREYPDGFYLLPAVLAFCSGTLATEAALLLFGVDVP